MANISFRKFKVSIDPESEKIQGLQENDLAVRQFTQKDMTQKFTLMVVESVGVETINKKQSSYFVGRLLYGDPPLSTEVLDFVRITSFTNSERSGSIMLSSSDENAPFINIINDLINNNAIFSPSDVGTMSDANGNPKNIIVGKGDLNAAYDDNTGEFSFVKKTNTPSAPADSSMISAVVDSQAVNPRETYIMFFEAKASQILNTTVKISDENTLNENMKSNISIGTEWRSYCYMFNFSEEYSRNIIQIAPIGNMLANTAVFLKNVSVVSVSSLSQYFDASQAVFGKLDGRSDSVIGKLHGYGVYCERLIATKSSEILGTLSVGDEYGSNNSFYVGKIGKNKFPDSTLSCLDKIIFSNSTKTTSLACSYFDFYGAPIGKGISVSVSKLASENDSVKIAIGECFVAKRMLNVSFFYCALYDSFLCDLNSNIVVDELNSEGAIVSTKIFKNSFVKGKWVRFTEKIFCNSSTKKIKLSVVCCVKNTSGSLNIGGVQVEYGKNPTLYQVTGDKLVNDDTYGFWANSGGIGGTIQDPLLKFNKDGSLKSNTDSFQLLPDGSAKFMGEFIVEDASGNKTIIVGGFLNTDIIKATSISAEKIKVDELKAQLITVENIQGLTLTFDKGYIGGWSIEKNKLSSVTQTNRINVSPVTGISFEDIVLKKFGFKVSANGSGELGFGVISWNALGVTIGEGASLNASSIKTGTIDASVINVTNINATNIKSGTIDASVITVTNINADNIKSGKISADFISGGVIDASLVTVTNINASNITAGEINAANVTITNINASNIKSGNILIGGVSGSIGELSILDGAGKELAYFSKDSRIAGWSIDDRKISKTNNGITIEIDSLSGITSYNANLKMSPFSFYADGSGQIGFDALKWSGDAKTITLGASVVLQWSAINSAAGNRFTQISGEGIYTGTLSANQINTGEIDASVITVKNLNASNISSGLISSQFLKINSSLTVGGTDNGEILVKDANNNVTASINRDGIKIGNKTVQDYVNGEVDSVQVGGRNYLRNSSLDHTARVGITDIRFVNGEVSGKDICISFWIDADKDGYAEFYPYITNDFVWDEGLPFINYKKGTQKIVYKTKMKPTWIGLAMVHAFALGPQITWGQKVEIGNKATDWSPAPEDVQSEIESSASISPTASFKKKYSSTETYIGNQFVTNVVFVDDNTSPTGVSYYKTKISAGSFSGIPVTNREKWESIGAQFSNMATGLALIDQAIIDNLVTRMLSTAESGPRVQVTGSLISVFGSSAKNIEMGVDSSGYAVLKYFSNDGKLLYNLGPRGIDWGSIQPASWSVVNLVKISSLNNPLILPDWYDVRDGVLGLPKSTASTFYKYFAGSNPEITQEEKDKEKYLYLSQSTTANKIADGWYCSAWNGMYGAYYSSETGEMIKPDGENGIYETVGGVVDRSPINIVHLYLYKGGQVVREANVYWNGTQTLKL